MRLQEKLSQQQNYLFPSNSGVMRAAITKFWNENPDDKIFIHGGHDTFFHFLLEKYFLGTIANSLREIKSNTNREFFFDLICDLKRILDSNHYYIPRENRYDPVLVSQVVYSFTWLELPRFLKILAKDVNKMVPPGKIKITDYDQQNFETRLAKIYPNIMAPASETFGGFGPIFPYYLEILAKDCGIEELSWDSKFAILGFDTTGVK